MKKIILIFSGFILSIILIELALQLVSYLLLNNLQNNIKKNVIDTTKITIMCIGESNTYKQYPIQLQEILDKEYPGKFNIIDCGLTGRKSVHILQELPNWINHYKPNMVISMIGGADWKIFPWEKNTYSKFYNLFKDLKLYKIYYYTIDYIKTKKSIKNKKIFNYTNMLFYTQDLIRKNLKVENGKVIINVNNINNDTIKDLLFVDKELKAFYAKNDKYTNYMLFKDLNNIDYAIIYSALLSKDINNTDNLIYNSEIVQYAKQEYLNQISQKDYNDVLYSQIAIEAIKNKNFEQATINFDKAENYRLKYYNFNTQQVYNEIVNMVYKNNIALISMQYPLRSIEPLKKLLSSNRYYNNIIFVSNEDIFKKYLYNVGSYSDLFTDQFAGDFGHCTDLGNEMIAENLKKYIISYYKEELK